MPFKSKAQQRFMFATMPETAKRWADHTPNIKGLPNKITNSDPEETKKKNKPKKPQEKAAGIRVILNRQNTLPSPTKAPLSMPKVLSRAVEKVAAVPVSGQKGENRGSQSAQSPRTKVAHESILGSVVHTPETARVVGATLEKVADKRLRAKLVADQVFQKTVASLLPDANNQGQPDARQKSAVALPAQGSLTTPLAQAQQQMSSFLPGKPQIAGQGVRPTGLDAPMAQDAQTQPQPAATPQGHATAVPGMEGTPAANPIDMHGPLDPRGLALDGNHAAGVQKGFKIASILDKIAPEGPAGKFVPKQQPPAYAADVDFVDSLNEQQLRDELRKRVQMIAQLRAHRDALLDFRPNDSP